MSDKHKSDLTTGLSSLDSVLNNAGMQSVLKQAELTNKFQAAIPKPLKMPRTLADFDRKFKEFDLDGLVALKRKIKDLDAYSDDDIKTLNDLEDALQGYINDYKEFKKLNSDQHRQITMKKAELELEHENHVLKLITQEAEAKLSSKYDWKAKWRHLFIKSLGTALFITLLLFVGWLVKTYEWAELPYSGLFKSVVPFPKP